MSGNNWIYQQLTPADENPITTDIKDIVAMGLNVDWKKFAYGILSDQEIQRIDLDNQTVYEKGLQMLTKWSASSPFEVTNAILKLKLNELERRDILMSIAEEVPSFGKLRFPDEPTRNYETPTPPSRPPRNVTEVDGRGKEIHITELSLRDIDELATKLDITYGAGISNWKNLAHEIIGRESQLFHQIKDLDLHYYGGGNPALEFFRQLAMKEPNVTIRQFQNVCKEFHRMDMSCYIDSNLSLDGLLRDITTEHKERLASFMNLSIPGVYDWEMFADEYGFKRQDINLMRAALREGGSYSPTKKLIDILQQSRPHTTLSEVKKACAKLGRNDVALILDRVIEKRKR